MSKGIITGLDIGSSNIRVLVAEYFSGEKTFIVRALVQVPSEGLKNGYVTNSERLTTKIAEALREAERIAGTRIKRANIAIGGVGLGTVMDTAVIAVSRADSIVNEFDVSRLVSESETKVAERPNIKILHTIGIEYRIDGRKIIGKPYGYAGNRLELRTMFITGATPHQDALVAAIEACGVEVTDVCASPVAESIVVLSATARNAGVALVNIGAETVSILVCEDGLPISLKIFPLGSNNITHDIALGLRISLEEAEKMKLLFGEKDLEKKIFKQVEDIVEARLTDVLELVDTHLRKIGRSALLPAGIIFTGAGSLIPGLENLARKQLSLPAKIGKSTIPGQIGGIPNAEGKGARLREKLEKARGPEWTITMGLVVMAVSEGPEESLSLRAVRRTKTGIVKFLRQFMP